MAGDTSRLVRFANFARMACSLRSLRGVGLPHFSRLTALKGTARRATTTDPLIPHPSLLIMGNHKGCPYKGTARRAPTPSFLTPTPSLLRPHSYALTPHSSLLTPLASLHPSFRACPGICLAVAACTLPPAPHGARARARHAVPLRPHPQGNHKGCPHDLTPTTSLLTPHSSLLTPHSSLLPPVESAIF